MSEQMVVRRCPECGATDRVSHKTVCIFDGHPEPEDVIFVPATQLEEAEKRITYLEEHNRELVDWHGRFLQQRDNAQAKLEEAEQERDGWRDRAWQQRDRAEEAERLEEELAEAVAYFKGREDWLWRKLKGTKYGYLFAAGVISAPRRQALKALADWRRHREGGSPPNRNKTPNQPYDDLPPEAHGALHYSEWTSTSPPSPTREEGE